MRGNVNCVNDRLPNSADNMSTQTEEIDAWLADRRRRFTSDHGRVLRNEGGCATALLCNAVVAPDVKERTKTARVGTLKRLASSLA